MPRGKANDAQPQVTILFIADDEINNQFRIIRGFSMEEEKAAWPRSVSRCTAGNTS
jgi:hypothetical protein